MSKVLQDGDTIANRYKIKAHVGAGGMQDVYQAIDLSLGRPVAVKVPKNSSAKKRFQRSAAMSAKVTHPNVAKTFDYLTFDGEEYLVEEFVVGTDLKTRFESDFVFLDPDLATHVFHHFVKGLAAVHRVGVLHRDLKPSNVMVSPDPDMSSIKITDFGIAKMAEIEIEENIGDDELTMASATVMGALPYMAPEVLQNSKLADISADIWSVGAILYHLLSGQLPYGGGVGVVAKVLTGKLPDKPSIIASSDAHFSKLCDDLWALILGCLKHNPSKRPTAQELVKACGQLCYSRAPRSIGTVREFGQRNGSWGFIDCSGSKDDAFFHGSSYWGRKRPKAGRRVSMAKFPGVPSDRACPVLPLRKMGEEDGE